MSVGTIITLVLFVGVFAAMFRMHRGGGHGMGGCGSHGSHGTPEASGTPEGQAAGVRDHASAPEGRITGSQEHRGHGSADARSSDARHRGC